MPDIVFQVDISADRATVARAIASEAGIRGSCTARADVPCAVGGVLKGGFAAAPPPFELRIDAFPRSTFAGRTSAPSPRTG